MLESPHLGGSRSYKYNYKSDRCELTERHWELQSLVSVFVTAGVKVHNSTTLNQARRPVKTLRLGLVGL